nr:bifunctional ornithine acetyltransferase/N-acetylglutamate synthase [Spirochaetota bacterium]
MDKNIEIILDAKLNDVKGFKSNAVSRQIKTSDKLDLGIVFSEKICDVFAAYTKNKYKAAPIIVCKEKLKNNKAQAIIVNSGNANACTGEDGISDAKLMCKLTSDALGIDDDNVVVSSTGVIGARLPMEKIKNGVALLRTKISEENNNNFCRGIMTTDTKMKIASVRVKTGNKDYTIFGCAKGSGMIHPNMATMLSFIT